MKLAIEYRITGTGPAKVCRNSNIPVPPRSYRAKLQHGTQVIKRAPLPPMTNGARETITIQPSSPAVGWLAERWRAIVLVMTPFFSKLFARQEIWQSLVLVERSGEGWRGRALSVPAPTGSDLAGALDIEVVADEITITLDYSHIHQV